MSLLYLLQQGMQRVTHSTKSETVNNPTQDKTEYQKKATQRVWVWIRLTSSTSDSDSMCAQAEVSQKEEAH
jgi:hypothetical protein